MFDVGVEGPLDAVLVSIRSVVAGVDLDGLDSLDAARVVERCAEAERLLAALRVLATATLVDKVLWRRGGVRSPAAWVAAQTGAAVGAAIATMDIGDQPCDLAEGAAAGRARRRFDGPANEVVRACVPG